MSDLDLIVVKMRQVTSRPNGAGKVPQSMNWVFGSIGGVSKDWADLETTVPE